MNNRMPRAGRLRALAVGMSALTAVCALSVALPRVANAAQSNEEALEIQRLRAALEAQMKVSQAIQNRLDSLESKEAATSKAQVEAAAKAADQAKTIAQISQSSGENGTFTMAGGRPTFTAFGGKGTLQIGLQAQMDAGSYMESNTSVRRSGVDLGDGVNARRVRIPFVFKYGDFTATVTPDWGGGPDGRSSTQYLYEANVAYSPSQVKGLTLALGYLQPNISLYDASSSNDFLFMERPAIMDIERNLAAGDARAAVGGRYNTDRFFVSAFLTGQAYGGQTSTNSSGQQTGAVARVAARPYYDADTDVHVGFSGSKIFSLNQTDLTSGAGGTAGALTLSERPELRVDQTRLVTTGGINASGAYSWNPELGLRYQNFMLMAEYVEIGVQQKNTIGKASPDLGFNGEYVDFSWVITGESKAYNASRGGFGSVKPAHPFNLDNGDWGAFEFGARYSETNLNDKVTRGIAAATTGGVAGGQQNIISVGMNWYPNEHLKFMGDYYIVDVSKLGGATLQNQVGLRYQAVGFRAQIAY